MLILPKDCHYFLINFHFQIEILITFRKDVNITSGFSLLFDSFSFSDEDSHYVSKRMSILHEDSHYFLIQ